MKISFIIQKIYRDCDNEFSRKITKIFIYVFKQNSDDERFLQKVSNLANFESKSKSLKNINRKYFNLLFSAILKQ